MLYGPCGVINPLLPCMKNGNCISFYPKSFQSSTIIDATGFPIYKIRDNGYIIEKNSAIFDNRHVVLYNPILLKKYHAHMNIEWGNQGSSIKYLYKYINKGYDRIIATISSYNDE